MEPWFNAKFTFARALGQTECQGPISMKIEALNVHDIHSMGCRAHSVASVGSMGLSCGGVQGGKAPGLGSVWQFECNVTALYVLFLSFFFFFVSLFLTFLFLS